MTNEQGTTLTEIARILGEPVETINDRTEDMVRLTQTGVIVSVTIRRYRGFTKLRNRDMGLSHNYGESNLIDLGSKRLLPKSIIRRMNSIDVTARAVLRNHGFATMWGQFIPAHMYPEVKRRLAELAADYKRVSESIIANYEQVISDMLYQYERQASLAYRRKTTLAQNELIDEDAFIVEYLERIRHAMPTREEIADTFDFEVKLSFVPLAPTMAYDATSALDALEQRKVIEGIEQLDAMEQMHQDVLEQSRTEQANLIGGFVRDMMVELRERTYLMMADIKKSIDKNGRIHPRSITALENWRELMTELNVYGDQDISVLVDKVREVTLYTNDERIDRNGEIGQVINDISTTISRSLTDLGIRSLSGRRKNAIEIPDVPDMSRDMARNRLGINHQAPPTPELIEGDALSLEFDVAVGNKTRRTRRTRAI